jgi:hypothetical protein
MSPLTTRHRPSVSYLYGVTAARPRSTPAPFNHLSLKERIKPMDLKQVEELYGQELVDATNSLIDHRVADMKRQVAEGDMRMKRQNVMHQMDRDPQLGAIWRDVNNDQRFIDYCNGVDELFNQLRMVALHRAFNNGEFEPVRAIFAGWLVQEKRLPPEAAPRATPDPFITGGPASSTRPNQPTAAGKKIYTRAEVRNFYEDCRAGKYDKDPAERRRIEADIIAASQEGRVEAPFRGDDKAILPPSSGAAKRRFRYRQSA